MEVSLIRSSQTKIGRTELACRELGFCNSKANGGKLLTSRSNISSAQSTKSKNVRLRFAPRALQSQPLRSDKGSSFSRISKSVSFQSEKLFWVCVLTA